MSEEILKLMAEDGETSQVQFTKTMSGRRTYKRMEDLSIENVPFYFQKESGHDILQSLRSLKEDINLGKDINWSILHPVIAELNTQEENLPYCVSFLKEITNLFVKYKCKEISIIVVVLRMLFGASRYDYNVIESSVQISKEIKLDAKNMVRHTTFLHDLYHEGDMNLLHAALGANLSALKLMLKFGMVMKPYCPADPDHFHLQVLDILQYQYELIDVSAVYSAAKKLKMFDYHLEDMRRYRESCMAYNSDDIYDDMDYNSDDIYDDMAYDEAMARTILEPSKRAWLIVAALRIVFCMKENEEFREKYSICYKLLFDSTKEPYLSCTELRTFLQSLLPESCNNVILQLVEMFKTFLPHVLEVSQPRSLKHLCRIRIRENLRLNYNLPHGVSSLKVPSNLKDYILLNDDNVYPIEMTKDNMDPFGMFTNSFGMFTNSFGMFINPFERVTRSPVIYKIPDDEDYVLAYIRNM